MVNLDEYLRVSEYNTFKIVITVLIFAISCYIFKTLIELVFNDTENWKYMNR